MAQYPRPPGKIMEACGFLAFAGNDQNQPFAFGLAAQDESVQRDMRLRKGLAVQIYPGLGRDFATDHGRVGLCVHPQGQRKYRVNRLWQSDQMRLFGHGWGRQGWLGRNLNLRGRLLGGGSVLLRYWFCMHRPDRPHNMIPKL